MPTPSGLQPLGWDIYQANSFCPYYNYYLLNAVRMGKDEVYETVQNELKCGM